MSEVENFTCEILSESDKACLVSAFGKEKWLPKSQIERMSRQGDTAEIVIPVWLFNRNFED